eukprot:scaffold947_cov155-Skeletonema_menzelii.AAC.12
MGCSGVEFEVRENNATTRQRPIFTRAHRASESFRFSFYLFFHPNSYSSLTRLTHSPLSLTMLAAMYFVLGRALSVYLIRPEE